MVLPALLAALVQPYMPSVTKKVSACHLNMMMNTVLVYCVLRPQQIALLTVLIQPCMASVTADGAAGV